MSYEDISLTTEYVHYDWMRLFSILTIDTDLEKKIGIGKKWPFPKLEADECLISSAVALRYNVTIGEDITLDS
jgi:hypothetical protein